MLDARRAQPVTSRYSPVNMNEHPCCYPHLEEVWLGGSPVLGLGHQRALGLDLSSRITRYVNMKRSPLTSRVPRVGGLLN